MGAAVVEAGKFKQQESIYSGIKEFRKSAHCDAYKIKSTNCSQLSSRTEFSRDQHSHLMPDSQKSSVPIKHQVFIHSQHSAAPMLTLTDRFQSPATSTHPAYRAVRRNTLLTKVHCFGKSVPREEAHEEKTHQRHKVLLLTNSQNATLPFICIRARDQLKYVMVQLIIKPGRLLLAHL